MSKFTKDQRVREHGGEDYHYIVIREATTEEAEVDAEKYGQAIGKGEDDLDVVPPYYWLRRVDDGSETVFSEDELELVE